MNVLLIGGGGREHALAWKIAQSSLLDALYITPGNPGMTRHGRCVELDLRDQRALRKFIQQHHIEMVVVGPEAPLVEGLHDRIADDPLLASSVTVIGPRRQAAMLEGSKRFAKEFMLRHNIPTAAFRAFGKSDLKEALDHIERVPPPFVIKADGLAAGKGVVITADRKEAVRVVRDMLSGKLLGPAGEQVVIEHCLRGVELSAFLITDGRSFKMLPTARDHKRVGDGDTGPNTGGMGAVSPVPFADRDLMQKVHDRIAAPTIRGLHEEGIPYQGFLFMGLMIVDGDPHVIEYNVRLGDPESEVILPRLRSDLLDLFEGMATGTLSERHVDVDDKTAVTVVLASEGYPGRYETGRPIVGIDLVRDAFVFHMGTAAGKKGELVTNGGRVVAVTAFGKDIEQAIANTYRNAALIAFDGRFCRSDIGHDLVRVGTTKSGSRAAHQQV